MFVTEFPYTSGPTLVHVKLKVLKISLQIQ